ncbi:monocarboxylate transporter 13-like [Tubulanus polymorphus]|uniref:monocarboxylate transporter 13-like n=1 Tax=Tubulanus polymorphus TaxID=672921 RepID=UPI003DA56DFD
MKDEHQVKDEMDRLHVTPPGSPRLHYHPRKSIGYFGSATTLDLPPEKPIAVEYSPPDGGWGWVVMIGMFFMQIMAASNAMCFGVLYMELLDYFRESHATTAWIGSLNVTCFSFTGFFTAILTNKFGHRWTIIGGSLIATVGFLSAGFCSTVYQLYFTYGIITGCGVGIAWTAALIGLGRYFSKRRGIAFGVALSGAGVGMISYPMLIEYLVQIYSWQGTLFIISGLWFNMCIVGALYRPLNIVKPKSNKKVDFQSLAEASLFKEWTFYTLSFAEICWTMAVFIYVYNIPDYTRNLGHSKEKASQLVLIMGSTLIPARLITGYIAQKNVNHIFCMATLVLIMSLVVGTCFLSKSYVFIAIYIACQGWLQGAIVVFIPLICTDLFGIERMGHAFSYIHVTDMVSTLAGPVLTGYIKDKTGSYVYAFILGGCCALLSSVCLFMIYLKICRDSRKNKTPQFEVQEEATKPVIDLPQP